MNFSNVKLATKLGLSFFSLVIITILLGGFSLIQMSRIYASGDDLASNWLPSIGTLGEIRTSLNQIRRIEGDLLMAADAQEREETERKLVVIQKRMAEEREHYQRLISSPQEKSRYDQFSRYVEQYLEIQTEIIRISRIADSEGTQARSLYRGASRTALNQAMDLLTQLVDVNSQGGQLAARESTENYGMARTWSLVMLAAACAVAATLALAIVRSVTRQLGGEPGDAATLASRVAAGDLTTDVALRPDDGHSMMAQLKEMQQRLSRVVFDVRGNAEHVATASAQIAQGNAELSQRTEEQASALEETAASMEQLNATVRQNAESAQQASRLASVASDVALRGGDLVQQVVATMGRIDDSARKITDIISVVDSIAFQTNILALNAAVEAARAGEQGRGFAVVASEVRNLAGRSAEAAREIKKLISSSVDQVEQGTSLVDRTGTTMQEIVQSIRSVAGLVGEISAASLEQSRGVAQVGDAISQMDQVTQQNAALVEESAAAAASLKQQAQQLLDAVTVFRLGGGGSSARTAVEVANHAAPAASTGRSGAASGLALQDPLA